ncbi:peptidoglycan DD-metalloendopeptidase family protein [Arenicella sp.]|nr:peptidoglycan DD-metalloendopeptidase family protein [Arenicella sp.]
MIKDKLLRTNRIASEMFGSNNTPKHRDPKRHNIKKRHWFLGSMVVLSGSWITHSTTATMSDGYNGNDKLGFVLILNEDESVPAVVTDSPGSGQNLAIKQAHLTTEPTLPPVPDLPLTETKVTIKKGQTLGLIFKKLSLDLGVAHQISTHEDAKRLVSLAIGKELTFRSTEDGELKQIRYPINSLQEFVVTFERGLIDSAVTTDLPYETVQHNVSATIDNSLYETALDSGLTINLVMELVQIFGWDVDFAQDIRSGDSFHVIYDDYRLNGKKLADGDILAAEFTTQGNTYQAIRFEDEGGSVSYYTPEGESMLGTFLRTPVEFSRISSGFGNRKHPILKTWRAHNGVDYAASRGTPIIATADGKVIHAGNKGGYGRTAILRHAGRFTTLYAHMNELAKGIRSGVTVKQGDVIGYVGSTGLATGPHLHYEFRVDGVHKNPLTYKTPKASSIDKSSFAAFKRHANKLVAELGTVSHNYQLAESKPTTSQL